MATAAPLAKLARPARKRNGWRHHLAVIRERRVLPRERRSRYIQGVSAQGGAAATRLHLGDFVWFRGAPGIGRLAEVRDNDAVVEFFESVAEPSVGSFTVPRENVRRVRLGRETRVFFKDDAGQWRAGRVVADAADPEGHVIYYVRLPNSSEDTRVSARDMRVRWDRRPRDPVQILLAGGNETPRYRDVRQPVRTLLLRDRASSASATGISSAGVQMHAHQVAAAFRIIRDPVQRYLLADEVGMGKTIEAGFVIRQALIDDPSRQVVVLCPDPLIQQWRAELRDKFFVDDFGDPVTVLGHSDIDAWAGLDGIDLLVVDEAHLLAKAATPTEPRYRALVRISHGSDRLLLLSATPFTKDSATHLALLHLLDGQHFSWDRREEFERLLDARRELAYAIYALDEDPDPENSELLEYQLQRLASHLPGDALLAELVATAMAAFAVDPPEPDALNRRVAAIRAHVSETYRLHQRVIRNRRQNIEYERLDDEGIMSPFSFTGRKRPVLAPLASQELDSVANFVEEWLSACRSHLLDEGLGASVYGPLAGVIVSRVGGSASDIQALMTYRLGLIRDWSCLSPDERIIVDSAPVLPFERSLFATLDSGGADAVKALRDAIVSISKPHDKIIVFCGRGQFAEQLLSALQGTIRGRQYAVGHLDGQSDEDRESAVGAWRSRGGVLVTDQSGEVGRNLQEANLVVHARLPWNPNQLEQRIGRVDRYGRSVTSNVVVFGDSNPVGPLATWARLLLHGFGVFERSISAEQEAVEDLAISAWSVLVTDGVEGLAALADMTAEGVAAETRRINEMDALEASWEISSLMSALAEGISKYDDLHNRIERHFRALITGVEGFRFDERAWDGNFRFSIHQRDEPLLSPWLLRMLQVEERARTGSFDRFSVQPEKRLFRRGNPFIDAVERVIQLDDRGQASAFWRLDPSWPQDTLIYFGMDFVVEADVAPLLKLLGRDDQFLATATRRCDWALPPFEGRVWIATNTMDAVEDKASLRFLNAPFDERRDKNLNPARIQALHNVLGAGNLTGVATTASDAALRSLLAMTALQARCARAAAKVAAETDVLLARSRARASAVGLVGCRL